jgi:acetyl esterase/lipase
VSLGAQEAAPSSEPAPVDNPRIEWSHRASWRSRLLALWLRLTMRPVLAAAVAVWALAVKYGPSGIELWRLWEWLHDVEDWCAGLVPPLRGSTVHRIRLGGCRAEYIRAAGVPVSGGPAILYFHGGGFVAGGLGVYRRFASALSAVTGTTVLNVGYRLLPRHPITSAIEDGVAGYQRLLDDGYRPEEIVFAGDSAGGGLTFLVAYAVVHSGLPSPAGLIGESPWANLDPTDKLELASARTDPVIPIRTTVFIVEKLIERGQILDAALSPVNLDLTGLPPSLIHVGTTEVLTPDSEQLAARLAQCGVPVTLKHWTGQVHVFQVLGLGLIPEASEALREMAAFVRERTS